MVSVLGDPALYIHIGGAPPSLDELRARYERQVAGESPDGASGWLNWVIRLRRDGEPVGFVQATLDERTADLAWVISPGQQGKGLATEAAAAVAESLRQTGTTELSAHIHPANRASEAVARRLGLDPTRVTREGETRWASG